MQANWNTSENIPFVCRPPLRPLLTLFLTHPHPPYCGSAHTWPSQIRALENQQAKRKAGCMMERREGIGGVGGVWPTGSFSIPMEQKVNDGPIVLWESWPEEMCYRESLPVPASSNKRGPAISCIEFLPYLYRLHDCFMSHWTSALSHSHCCKVCLKQWSATELMIWFF